MYEFCMLMKAGKYHKLSNHLGNVNTVISDRKKQTAVAGSYLADIKSYVDYYPFGYQMKERTWQQDDYRYGFNGQEKDDEIVGTGSHLDFKFRGYDSRIGRFWSVDPLSPQYPWNSTYSFAENRVIDGVDLEGLEWAYFGKDKEQIDMNENTTNEDRLNITGARWVGYDTDENGNKTPKPGTVSTAYIFQKDRMYTLGADANYKPTLHFDLYSDISTGDKMADKSIATLDPIIQDDMKKLILMGRLRFGIDVRGTPLGRHRTYAEQDALYAIGRTAQTDRKTVTNAKGGFSNHNFGLAIDIAIYDKNGQYLSKGTEWQYNIMGKIGKTKIGLEWGGDWTDPFDPSHFQNMQGYTMPQLRSLPKDEKGFIKR